ncbi:MAG TPA: alanyl-tRNA editing protein [Dongiaceae bacterium]|nr:alanyl-tRNA editing protein [Dongiaceae bacterium]
MTRKLFWPDPYRAALATRVAAVAGEEVRLEETIFYALSGGQESDRGTIGGRPVLEARKEGPEIVYRLPEGHGLRPGQAVRVEIDWPRRYRLMRLHFAAEVVLELVYRRLPGTAKTGAHIAEDKARIDFEHQGSLAPLLPELQAEAQGIVAADHAIESGFSDEAAERRYWKIPGLAEVPCGGTHLRRTGEIGEITLRRRNPGKGRERIEIHVDERAPPPASGLAPAQ